MTEHPAASPAPPAALGLVATLRSLLFNLLFWSWTSLMLFALLPALVGPWRRVIAAATFWQRGIAWLLRVVMGLGHEVRGRELLPAEPVIYALKHQSAWETVTSLVWLGDTAIALKRELMAIPIFGSYLARSGMIRIDRDEGMKALRSLVEGARAALADGRSILIFPEGTRVAPDERRPYQPGVAALYTRLERPVVPVALNSGMYWRRRSFVKRPGRIVVQFLAPIPPGLPRKTFMAELEQRLEEATRQLVAEARRA